MDKPYYVLLVLSLLSFSCGNGGTKSGNSHNGTNGIGIEENEFSTLDTLKGLEMWLVPNTFKAHDPRKTVRCWFRSDTEYRLTMGTPFAVEKWNGSKWVLFPAFRNQVVLDMLLGVLASKEPAEVDYDYCVSCLANGAKEKGKYRMVIEISQSDDYKLEKAFKAFAEFTVE